MASHTSTAGRSAWLSAWLCIGTGLIQRIKKLKNKQIKDKLLAAIGHVRLSVVIIHDEAEIPFSSDKLSLYVHFGFFSFQGVRCVHCNIIAIGRSMEWFLIILTLSLVHCFLPSSFTFARVRQRHSHFLSHNILGREPRMLSLPPRMLRLRSSDCNAGLERGCHSQCYNKCLPRECCPKINHLI